MKKMMALVLCTLVLLSGCGGQREGMPDSTAPAPEVQIEAVQRVVAKESLHLQVNRTKTGNVEAQIQPAEAGGQAIQYESSNKAVATVDSNGRVTAVAPGKCTVRSTTSGKAAVTAVEVTLAPERIELDPAELWLTVGTVHTLLTKLYPEDAVAELACSSSDEAVATVETAEDGTLSLIANAAGTAQITVLCADYTDILVVCTLTVGEPGYAAPATSGGGGAAPADSPEAPPEAPPSETAPDTEGPPATTDTPPAEEPAPAPAPEPEPSPAPAPEPAPEPQARPRQFDAVAPLEGEIYDGPSLAEQQNVCENCGAPFECYMASTIGYHIGYGVNYYTCPYGDSSWIAMVYIVAPPGEHENPLGGD